MAPSKTRWRAPAFLLLCNFLLVFFQPSRSDAPPAAATPPDTACRSTPYPSFCKSVLPGGGAPAGNLYDYGRFSVARSLSSARKFSALVDRYMARRSALSESAVRALEDCQLLSGLNIDYLTTAGAALNATAAGLLDPQAERVQALLSALLTNQQTCLDGLRDTAASWSAVGGLYVPLANDTKLYSVSLALFSRAWVVPKKKLLRAGGFTRERIPKMPGRGRGRGLLFHELDLGGGGASLPLAASDADRRLFESRSGRRLLQSSSSSSQQQVSVSAVVVVSRDGTGNFTTVAAAVASAPNNTGAADGYYMIYVTAGVYEENVVVPKNNKYVMMVGDGVNQTVVTGNRSVVDGWTTFNSATFAVVGEGFVAINMTFRNTAGAAKHQAVALRSGADLSTFYGCSFEGYQDTLYAHSLRQFYRRCDVYGTVDFIFGNAAALLQSCGIYSRLPMPGQQNTITAQGRTDPNQNTGISIQNCSILAAPDLAGGGTAGQPITYLGRPWKLYSRTVVMESFVDGLVHPDGWLPWSGDFALSTLYYAEHGNSGPGASTAARVTWPGYHVINSTEAANFTVANFITGDDWLPRTGVSYQSGLI